MGMDIDVGFISTPVPTDYNGDGLLDLLVGREFTDGGSTRLYLNQGAQGEPQLGEPVALESSGSVIFHWRTGPQLGDMDGDGITDLVIAGGGYGPFGGGFEGDPDSSGGEEDEHWGWVHYYRNYGTEDEPEFQDSVVLYSDGQPIYRDHHNICLYDWNGDGRLDILSGDYEGQLLLYLAQPTGISRERAGAQPGTPLLQVVGSPSDGEFLLRITTPLAGRYRARLMSMDGRLRRVILNADLPAGLTSIAASSAELVPGVYMVTCSGDAAFGSDMLLVVP